ncbi:uncharacterized protein STEHIDRAFT_111847 [Stereum hirsutum FP-91666 SS1]|uniref:uncharacterized protein n=1 Tax=Stereum hirsutum (strain FP-91666) TaxID=721885 RepID=UPI000444A57F|nr:uncharacterized protein STEHIDRAFT_111847 [Stereum hirsutum FP-91666 SS1]EIM85221.1 hypothetical protein STEHIDRAFT_111847 [Stereum hirsutum FP-91666 SS1]
MPSNRTKHTLYRIQRPPTEFVVDAQIDQAVGICIRAYDGDTALKAMLGDDLKLTDIFFRSMLRGGALEGSFYIANDGKNTSVVSSVSVCFPPGVSWVYLVGEAKSSGNWDFMSSGMDSLLKRNIGGRAHKGKRRLGTEWVVSLIATDPAEQHKGHATSIMNEICDQAAREHRMVGLSTQTLDNAAWYESLGFTKLGERQVAAPTNDFPSILLVKEPSS